MLRDTEAFGQLLLRKPELGRFIRHINIFIRVTPPSAYRSTLSGISSNLFDLVLHQLTRLQSVMICHYAGPETAMEWKRPQLDWSQMKSSIQHSLLDLLDLPTVTHLELGWMQNFPISNLISCTHLKHLSFTFVVDSSEQISDALTGLCKELKEISGTNTLESIKIVFDIRFEVQEFDVHDFNPWGDHWGELEKVLLHPGWPTLKQASISIIIYGEYDDILKADLASQLETEFARLISSNNFNFQISICEKEPSPHLMVNYY